MSVLTKVFVILVNVFSIALVAMVVVFVANTENFKAKFEKEHNDRLAVERRLKLAETDVAASTQDAQKQIAKIDSDRKDLENKLSATSQQLADARHRAEASKGSVATLSAEVTALRTALDQNAAILKDTLSELDKRRQSLVQEQSKNIDLTAHNNELRGQIQALEQQVRYVNEQLASIESEKSRLEQFVRTLPPEQRQRLAGGQVETGNTPVIAESAIRGQVTQVKQVGEKLMVQVNIGKADRVQPNMKFLIHRGDKFLGNLMIISVDDRAAAGQVDLPQGAINIGDLIQSSTF